MRRPSTNPLRFEVRFTAAAWKQVGELSEADFDELYGQLGRVAELAAISEGLISRDASERFGVPLSVQTPNLSATYDLDCRGRTLLVREIFRS